MRAFTQQQQSGEFAGVLIMQRFSLLSCLTDLPRLKLSLSIHSQSLGNNSYLPHLRQRPPSSSFVCFSHSPSPPATFLLSISTAKTSGRFPGRGVLCLKKNNNNNTSSPCSSPLTLSPQFGGGQRRAHEALLQRLLHRRPEASRQDRGLHLRPLPGDQRAAREEHRRPVERHGRRG